jgi:hypothetical protein
MGNYMFSYVVLANNLSASVFNRFVIFTGNK